MSASTVLGYAARSLGEMLEPMTYVPPLLTDNDIRVAVTHCGICHTDIQAIDDYYGITTFPFVPGHEIVGLVTEAGAGVVDFKEGDRVGIGWQGRSCGQCEWCQKGEEQLCLKIAKAGAWLPYGGFSSSIVVDSRFAYLIPEGLPSQDAAVLMCAGIATYAPLQRYKAASPQKLGIVGLGGLGHLAIQFAHSLNYDVTVLSTTPEKEEEALAFGADDFIVSIRSNLEKIEYTFDLLLCTATGKVNFEQLLWTLKKKGQLILVGFPDMALNTTDLVAHQLSITGSFLGTRATMREMLAFAQANGINPLVELMPMAKVNEALQRVKENKARYRIVLTN